MTYDADLAIAGSGFGGSILAMVAQRLGLRTVLIERGHHPRFAIGESSSPLAGLLLEELAARYDLPRLAPLGSFGAWQRSYPDVVCGLKRGFTFYKHEAGCPYRSTPRRGNQLLVAASPSNELSDTHWLRADVDHFLVREAVEQGAALIEGATIDAIERRPEGGFGLGVAAGGRHHRVRARMVVDASGPRGALARAMGVQEGSFSAYPGTQALYTHFEGVRRCDEMTDYDAPSTRGGAPPYPPDDAALHHVFDDGWMWVLRFGNGVTSAGVALTDAAAVTLRIADGESAWQRLLAQYPTIAEQFADARPLRPFAWMPHLPYRASTAVGPGWAMLPSAAAFVDPLFSTGFPLTLLGIERLAGVLERYGTFDGEAAADLAAYETITLAEADHTASFISGCYAAFRRFDVFTARSMFYFAAASYAEVARRLSAPAVPRQFLCADDRRFAEATIRLASGVPSSASGRRHARAIACAIAPLNIAGLCKPEKWNWYDVDPADTIRHADRLGVTADAARALFAQMGV